MILCSIDFHKFSYICSAIYCNSTFQHCFNICFLTGLQELHDLKNLQFVTDKKIETNFHPVQFLCQLFYMVCKIKNCCTETPKYCFISVFVIENFRVSQTPQGFYNWFLKAFVCHDCYSIQLVFLHADANSTDILFYIWFFSFREQFLAYRRQIGFFCCLRAKWKIISMKKMVPVLTRQGRSFFLSRARFFSSTAMNSSCRWQIFLFLECSSLTFQHWQDNHYPRLFKNY